MIKAATKIGAHMVGNASQEIDAIISNVPSTSLKARKCPEAALRALIAEAVGLNV